MNTTAITPQMKVVSPATYLLFRIHTTYKELQKWQTVAADLTMEARRLNLEVTGTLEWHYFTFDMEKPFTLEVCLPVSHSVDGYDGKFHFKRTEPFSCGSLFHEGDWASLYNAYGLLMGFMKEKGLTPLEDAREVYVHMDLQNPSLNRTEIQLAFH